MLKLDKQYEKYPTIPGVECQCCPRVKRYNVTIARRDDILGTVARQINEEQLIFLFFFFFVLSWKAQLDRRARTYDRELNRI